VKVDGIIDNGYLDALISSRENMADMMDMDESIYNVVLSDHRMDIADSKTSEIITEQTYKDQMNTLLKSMGAIIYSLIVIGVLICIASLFATVNMMIEENRNNISMLKVLGYDNRRINSMILNSNHLLLVPGVLLGLGAAYLIMLWYATYFVDIEGIMIPATIGTKGIILTVAITVASYFFALLLVRGKADKVDMVESLKDNRE
jgi:putative ABC transport system permease protein